VTSLRIYCLFILTLVCAAPYCAAQQQDQTFDECARQFQRLRVAPKLIGGSSTKTALPDAADMDPSQDFNVKVKVLVDKAGVVRCAVGVDGAPELYERCARTARQWKFQPYFLNGEPIAVESAIYFHFSRGKVEVNFPAK
jgi:Gram-negative bacterial TonB protein C-terminal